jgi:hypothetical protein
MVNAGLKGERLIKTPFVSLLFQFHRLDKERNTGEEIPKIDEDKMRGKKGVQTPKFQTQCRSTTRRVKHIESKRRDNRTRE